MQLAGFPRYRRFCAAFAVIIAAIAAISASPPVRARTPPHIALVIRLNADGSLLLSQRGKEAGAVTTLPAIQALPAQIDALVPRMADRKKLAVAAEPTVSYGNLLNLMNMAKKAGFSDVGILRPEKDPHGEPAELAVHLQGGGLPPLTGNPLFVSLGRMEMSSFR
jgi:biopolymer transport protein ExbD